MVARGLLITLTADRRAIWGDWGLRSLCRVQGGPASALPSDILADNYVIRTDLLRRTLLRRAFVRERGRRRY